jgi:hypothetical protein
MLISPMIAIVCKVVDLAEILLLAAVLFAIRLSEQNAPTRWPCLPSAGSCLHTEAYLAYMGFTKLVVELAVEEFEGWEWLRLEGC